MSYYAELIVARKFTDWLSFQVSGSFAHINKVDTLQEHDGFGITFSGRARVSPQSSVIFNYGIPLNVKGISENRGFTDASMPNLGIGWEIATSTHVFQIFVASSTALSPQYTLMDNHSDWTQGDLYFGFTITRLWSF
jgi:hypothetical protein